MEILGTLNSVEKQKNRFVSIQKLLNRISQTVDSLQLWIENSIVDGKLNKETWEHMTKDLKCCQKQAEE